MKRDIVFFEEISKNDIKSVGGKGASLGELTKAGILVPPGFVISTEIFKLYNHTELPQEIQEKILSSFDRLNAERVAVRSSAVAEDSGSASWAGQLESYLNVSRNELIEKIQNCWSSIESNRAKEYIKDKSIFESDLLVAVVVQKMVDSEASGVMFTANPVSSDKNQVLIEAAYGLGEMLVQGQITPDKYIIDKSTNKIVDKTLNTQGKMLVFKDGKNQEIDVPKEKRGRQVLTANEVQTLVQLAQEIENYYGSPQDIEWAKEEGAFYIVQSRPITTLSDEVTKTNTKIYEKLFSRDFCLASVEAWVRGESTNPKGWTEKQQPFLPYIITERSDDTVHFHYDLQGVEWVTDLLSELAHKDKSFLGKIEKSVLEKLAFIRPIYEEERVLHLSDLKRFIQELEDGYPWFEAMWWFFQMDDESKVAGLDLENLAKVRTLTDKLCNSSDTVIRKSLLKLFPDLEELSSLLLTEEIMSGNIPEKEILEKRDKSYYFANNQLLINSDKHFIEEKFGIKFQTEIVAKDRQLTGVVAYRGVVRGFVRRVMGHKQIDEVQEGEILISPMTIPDFLPAMKKAAAIVTDEGGMLSHAAIVARELKKPTIVGSQIATKRLQGGDIVEVNALEGKVTLICHALIVANELKKPCIIGTHFSTDLFEDGDYIEVDADKGIITLLNKKDELKKIKKTIPWHHLFS